MSEVEWGEYKLGDLFDIKSSKKIFHANKTKIYDNLEIDTYPYITRKTTDNGVRGYIKENLKYLNPSNTLSFAQDTFTVFYQEKPYFTGNKVKILIPKFNLNNRIAIYCISILNSSLHNYNWGNNSDVNFINDLLIKLPTSDGVNPDFEFMGFFIAELEAQRYAELEAYLLVTGLKDYKLTEEERICLNDYNNINWSEFNLENLYGKATRGKRLKSEDRINGNLPFVTAGENSEGISDYISNEVEIFSSNTTTIDMFGSAKYRNYKYGADDHIAVVHTEKVPKLASIFVTSAIHKSSHTGKFDYGHNFYAKDADELNVMLPAKNGIPDYEYMGNIISAIQKLVIKDVVEYTDKKIKATKQVIDK